MSPTSTPRSERKRRRWLIVLVAIVAMPLLLVAFAPTLLSGPGKSIIVNAINGMIKGSVEIDSISLSWFSGQGLAGIELLDPQGKRVATLDTFSTELSLWSAIVGDMNLGRTLISGLDADLLVDETGGTNLLRSVESTNPSPSSDQPARMPRSLVIDAELKDATIKVMTPESDPVVFDQLTARVKIDAITQPIALSFAGRTQGLSDVEVAFEATMFGIALSDPK